MKSVKGKGLAFILITIMIMSVLIIPLKVTAQDKLPDFKDVPKTAWYYDYVSSLAELGIVKGYGDSGEFRPMNLVTREHATKMILLATQVGHSIKSAPVSKANIVLEDGIKRDQAAKMIQVAFGLKTSTKELKIKDLPAHDPELAEAIEILASNGVVKGYGQSDYFKPDHDVNRAEFAKMLCLAMAAKAIQDAEIQGSPDTISLAQIQVDRLSKTQDADSKAFLQARLDSLKDTVDRGPINIYTVTFDLNYQGAGPGEERKSSLSKVSIPGDPIRTGYTFKGWNTQADGQGTAFTEDSLVKDHLRVYAQWKEGEPDYEALLLMDVAELKDALIDHVIDLRTTDVDPWTMYTKGSHGSSLAWGSPYTPSGTSALVTNKDLLTLSFADWNETATRTSHMSVTMQNGSAKRVIVFKVIANRYSIPIPDGRRFSWRIEEHGLFLDESQAVKALLSEFMDLSGGPDDIAPDVSIRLLHTVGVYGTSLSWGPVTTQHGMEASVQKIDNGRSLKLIFPNGKDYNPNLSTITARIALPGGRDPDLINFMIITSRASSPTHFSWAIWLL